MTPEQAASETYSVLKLTWLHRADCCRTSFMLLCRAFRRSCIQQWRVCKVDQPGTQCASCLLTCLQEKLMLLWTPIRCLWHLQKRLLLLLSHSHECSSLHAKNESLLTFQNCCKRVLLWYLYIELSCFSTRTGHGPRATRRFGQKGL